MPAGLRSVAADFDPARRDGVGRRSGLSGREKCVREGRSAAYWRGGWTKWPGRRRARAHYREGTTATAGGYSQLPKPYWGDAATGIAQSAAIDRARGGHGRGGE